MDKAKAMHRHLQKPTGPGQGSLKTRTFPALLIFACAVGTLLCTPLPLAAEQASRGQSPNDASATEQDTFGRDGRAGPVDLEDLAAMATAAVVLVEVDTGDRSRQGSGFIVEQDGLILTNYHVIRNARDAKVRLASGDLYDRVSVMATDERRDLAIIKISGFGLPTLPLGNSDSVRIGTDVIAIGSPMGLENTVSTGIISGRRSEPEGFHLLQITAPASTGSSGGPVLDRAGRVVGIAASQFRNGQNLNFAVPVNYARGMLSELDGEPLAVLDRSVGLVDRDRASSEEEMAADEGRVNRGLDFDMSEFEDHELELRIRQRNGTTRHTTVTYRRIEDIAGGDPRIERYVESETTIQADSSASSARTIRRERHRSLVRAGDLAPVSSRGEVRVADGDGERDWRTSAYDLRFDDGRVTGTVTDEAGVVRQIDREVPPGTVLREMRHLAFGRLAVDTDRLIGRSMELHTFDSASAEMRIDRFDIRRRTTIETDRGGRRALLVDVASGLVNERHYFTQDVPRRLLRREDAETGAVEEVVDFSRIPVPGT